MKSTLNGRLSYLVTTAILLLVFGTWYLLFLKKAKPDSLQIQKSSISRINATGANQNRSLEGISASKATRRNTLASHSSAASSARTSELVRLKQKWLELGSGDHDLELRDALARESALKLSCSMELVELANFLRERGITAGRFAGSDLEDVAYISLSTEGSENARQVLIEAIGKGLSKKLILCWCNSAGRFCPPEKFQEFLDQLAAVSEEGASMAIMGRARETVQADPAGTIAIAMDALEKVPSESLQLNSLFIRLSPSTDFASVATIIQQKDPDGIRFDTAVNSLFNRWAGFDSVGAANYVLANSQNYPTELISLIASRADPDDAIEWIGHFPRGIYRDAAASGLAKGYGLSNSVKAREIAAVIEDPNVRANTIKSIEASERTIRSGDKY
jgi:hypothetical protein